MKPPIIKEQDRIDTLEFHVLIVKLHIKRALDKILAKPVMCLVNIINWMTLKLRTYNDKTEQHDTRRK